jgi:hypothetical protein
MNYQVVFNKGKQLGDVVIRDNYIHLFVKTDKPDEFIGDKYKDRIHSQHTALQIACQKLNYILHEANNLTVHIEKWMIPNLTMAIMDGIVKRPNVITYLY